MTNKPRKLNIRQRKALDKIVENGGIVSKALRDSGYTDAYAKNPDKFLNTTAVKKTLEDWFPDEMLNKATVDLINSAEITSFTFPIAKNKQKKPLSDQEIKYIVENVAGCKLIYIRDCAFPPSRIAFFQTPALKSRKDGLELAFKLKGSFAPEKLDINKLNPFSTWSDAELATAIKEAKAVLTKKK